MFYICTNKNKQILEIMTITEINKLKIEALKKINETKWNGNIVLTNLDACLTGINLESGNSGWYKPKAVRINGLKGIFMLNEDGSLFCEAKVIKESANEFRIEYISMDGWNEFEKLYTSKL